MCLIAFAVDSHPRYPLVVVANRDEYHDRTAQPAHWWPDSPHLLAGRDLRAGGTWMGVTIDGGWGAVTNFRDGNYEAAPRSRGDLVTGYLRGNREPGEHLRAVAARGEEYAGFNLLVGDASGTYYYSNRGRPRQAVPPGLHSLSNHLLDTPWPKAELALLKLNRALHHERLEVEPLMAVLADQARFEDHELPATGVTIEMERALSPPFINGPHYGTRCTTVFTIDADGEAVFAEQNFGPGGVPEELILYEFTVGVGS